jgi:hypothetical protein
MLGKSVFEGYLLLLLENIPFEKASSKKESFLL